MSNPKNYDAERHALAGVLKHPEILPDVSFFVKEEDFELPAHKVIYSTMLDALSKGESTSVFRLSEKMHNAGIVMTDVDASAKDYLEHLNLIQINQVGALESFKELAKMSVRRGYYRMAKSLMTAMQHNGNSSIDEIITEADAIYAGVDPSRESETGGVVAEDICEGLVERIEERGNNPLKDVGLKTPFRRLNAIYGSLMKKGAINVVAARTGVGKTQLGQFCMLHVLATSDIPVLHMDMGEMTKEELQDRMVTMLTGGKVSPTLLEEGSWRQNPALEKITREALSKIPSMMKRYFYKDVSNMTPDQIVSFCKRFYLSKVKPRQIKTEDGLEFVIFYDYLKAFESTDRNTLEHQLLGHFIQKMKSLLKNKLPASLWTSLQVNRTGIVGNKSADKIDDTENVFGLSDRIIQQVTHGWLLRERSIDELANEPFEGANYTMICRKRRSLGKDKDAELNPVKMPDGTLRKNVLYFKVKNFVWEEIGDLESLKDNIIAPPNNDDDARSHVKRELADAQL